MLACNAIVNRSYQDHLQYVTSHVSRRLYVIDIGAKSTRSQEDKVNPLLLLIIVVMQV
jgi:hypothetical protein